MATETLRPNAELSDAGLVANDYTDHDDDPDASFATVNATGNNVSTQWGADFPIPSGNPTVGASLQEFRAGVEEFDNTQSGTPNARVELWENGALVRAGPNVPVSGYAVLSFTWDANELATVDGGLVQCKVIGTKSGGSPGARNAVRIGHVEWNVDYGVGATTYYETLAVTAVGVVGLSRAVIFTKTLAATALGAAGLSTLTTWYRVLATTVVGVAGLLKKTSTTLVATAVGSAGLIAATLYTKTLAAIAGGVAGLAAVYNVASETARSTWNELATRLGL